MLFLITKASPTMVAIPATTASAKCWDKIENAVLVSNGNTV